MTDLPVRWGMEDLRNGGEGGGSPSNTGMILKWGARGG